MRLTVLGRSPARPNPGEACAGYVIEGGGSRLLFDIGPGVVAQLLRRHHPDELDAVIISHMHADHMLDLVTLRYVYPWRRLSADERLRVVLPPGSADQLLDLAKGVGGAKHFEDAFQLSEHDSTTPFRFGSLTVTPRETQHYIPCWGFRVEADGRRLAYTADTAPCSGLTDLADDADLLLSEATLRSLDEDAQPPEPRGHLTPAEAGAVARDGGARRLVLTHLPVNGDDATWARTDAATTFGSEVEIAEPSKTYEI
ncbi:MAG: MBL fold metallo-hydrolase [Chloroflexota bacterium]|jgi:ribonuclease BN (tRNA processing enzyme)|nr:MBL fold metallo-hydrolase [Chloroflexota bacterium]